MESIDNFLQERKDKGLLRYLRPFCFKKQGRIYTNNGVFIDLSSNDYLGLSNHPYLIEKTKQAIDKLGVSSTASRLLSGDFEVHHRLEEKTAEFKGKEAAIVFNSGYHANTGIIPALFCKNDAIFADKLLHASMVDGIILSRANLFRFRHNDINHLEYLLEQNREKYKNALILTEAIFSMDGDRGELKNILELKNKFNCLLMVDEAHSTGIYGKMGSGIVEEQGMSSDVDLIMGTFSKALAGFGGYLATEKKIVNYLINTSRSFIYSTALPPHISCCNLAALELVEKEPERRKILLQQANLFKETLIGKGYNVLGNSQIVSLVIGDNLKTQSMSEFLMEHKYWTFPIRPPTVPEGTSRLRFSITYHHNKQILQSLLDLI
jgi:8-amino-7-oxononanoate synthase